MGPPRLGTYFFVVVIVLMYSSTTLAQHPQNPSPTVTLHWTDRGVGQWDPNLRMFDNFSVVPHGGVIGVPPQAQILMPMPPLDQLPKNEQEWQALSDKIYLGLRIKVQSAVASGNSNLEVLQIENVTLAQHLEGTVLKSESSILESILPDLKSILPSAEVQQAVEVQQNNVKFAGAVGQAIYKV